MADAFVTVALMKSRRIGTIEVGAIGLGAMPMSVRRSNDEQLGVQTIHAALDAGVTLIDTADAYTPNDRGLGHNEELIAGALASYGGDIERVLVATKAGMTRDGAAWGTDGRPEWIRQACENSLRRLGVDAIGLYQHHRPDSNVPYAETIGAFKELHEAGKVRAVGVSNADPRQIREAYDILADALVSVQNEFSPKFLSSRPELELCDELGLAFLPWSPLGGMSEAAGLGSRYDAFGNVATELGVSPQQVCLAWELAQSPVVVPIPGASKPASVQDSARAADLVLTHDQLASLNTLG